MRSSVQIVVDRSVRRRIARPVLVEIERAVRRLVRAAAGPEGAVELRVCDDAAIAGLHASAFGDRHATDVLSFPEGEGVPGPEPSPLGVIVINWDAVERQAARRDPAGLRGEAVSLCLHSVAHLLGHDHGTRGEARRMLATERRLGRRIGMRPRRPYGGGL